VAKVERGYDRLFSPMSSLQNFEKGTTFPSVLHLDLDENARSRFRATFTAGC